MIQIYKSLYVGSEHDYWTIPGDWKIVQACKEPYHRKAIGYSGTLSKTHPEYLFALRDNRLILNLVDSQDPAYILPEIINKAIEFIHENLDRHNVLVHCNQGRSRGPSIGLLYLLSHTDLFKELNYNEIMFEYKKLYPYFSPALGMSGYIRNIVCGV